jgi:hypothetical protein
MTDKWRIAENEWNLQQPPWRGAIGIENVGDLGLAVPSIVCWVTRGNPDHYPALIAAAPELLAALRGVYENPVYNPAWDKATELLSRFEDPT